MTDKLEAIRLGPFSRALMTAMIRVASRALNSYQLACLVFPMAAMVFVGPARADLLTQYSFTDATLNRSATTVAANVTAGNITDAPTVNGNPTVVLVRTTTVGYATEPVLSAARANFNESLVRANVYFTFTVSANAGMELDLTSLTFNVSQGGGTANTRDYDIRSSADAFAVSLTGVVLIPTAAVATSEHDERDRTRAAHWCPAHCKSDKESYHGELSRYVAGACRHRFHPQYPLIVSPFLRVESARYMG